MNKIENKIDKNRQQFTENSCDALNDPEPNSEKNKEQDREKK